jgi:hypothetical protein
MLFFYKLFLAVEAFPVSEHPWSYPAHWCGHFLPLWRVVSAISFLFDGIFDDRAEKCYFQCWFSLHADFY